MQTFIDSTTQQKWAFDDDVVATEDNDAYTFSDACGVPIAAPSTLTPYVPSAADIAAQQADAARAKLMAQVNSALAGGLTITSIGTSALNGTYAVDQLSQMDIIAIETSLNAGKGFPGGATEFGYPDSLGALHMFTEANFTDFAASVRDFVYGIKAVISGAETTLPPSTTTIS
jgi:hypothetical protein